MRSNLTHRQTRKIQIADPLPHLSRHSWRAHHHQRIARVKIESKPLIHRPDGLDYATAAFARARAPRARSGPFRTSNEKSPLPSAPPSGLKSTDTEPPSKTPRATIIFAMDVIIFVCMRRFSGRAPYCGLYPSFAKCLSAARESVRAML